MNKFPHYTQLDGMDCGPACLRIIAAHYGKKYSLSYIRQLCHVTREGVSILGLRDAAESIGINLIANEITWQELQKEVDLPCVLYVNQQHFIVIYCIKRKKKHTYIYVSDPSVGLLEYTEDQFLKMWIQPSSTQDDNLGIALTVDVMPVFYKHKEPNCHKHIDLSYLITYIHPYRKYISVMGIAMLLGSILSVLFPFLTQAVVDIGIGTVDLHLIIVILFAQIMLVIGKMVSDFISNWIALHLTVRISITLVSDFLNKLMRLPIAFFDTRKVGDIIQRIEDHNRIQLFLTTTLLGVVMGVILLVVYSAIMICYNWSIFLIFLFGSILYVVWVLLFMSKRKKLDYIRFKESAANQNSIIQLITGMLDIKLNNCEQQKRRDWEEIQSKLYQVSIKGLAIGQAQYFGGGLIEQMKNVIISFMAAKLVIDGNMTLGMMMAIQYIIGQLNAPVAQFISFAQEFQDAQISMERLGEIHTQEDEDVRDANKLNQIPCGAIIEFRSVSFQYDGPKSAKVLNNINICFPANKTTAIVGTSGSGKTTLLKLFLGFYEPTGGQIFINGEQLANYNCRSWRAQCGVVMQDGYIFSDTIAKNIAVSDKIPNTNRVEAAAEIAHICDFINSLPLKYNTIVGAEGQGLSSGQKQRILIARAAYKDAAYLLLDEATNSLDANNERSIMKKLEELFHNKTVIIVAHRLSTVKNADCIIVLDEGIIVEQGTHIQLVNNGGYYYNLIKNQLDLGH